MFNKVTQAFSLFFGNTSSPVSEPIEMAKGMKAEEANPSSKKRAAEAMLASDSPEASHDAPVRKRGRPLRGQSKTSVSYNSPDHTESDSSSSEPVVRTRRRITANRTVRNDISATSESGSEYEGSDDEEQDEEESHPVKGRRGKREVDPALIRRSSRTTVLKSETNAAGSAMKTPVHSSHRHHATGPASRSGGGALQRSVSEGSAAAGGGGSIAPFLASASMRRSRRSRNVDVTKELVVMLPGDDPRTMAQLDLRGDIEWDEFLIAMAEDTSAMLSDNEDAEHTLHNVSSTYSLSGMATTPGAPEISGHSNNSAGRSIRQRSTSSASLNNLAGESSSMARSNGGGPALDPQHLQYLDILSVNNVASTAEVYVPEVKEAALSRTLSVVRSLGDPAQLAALAAEEHPRISSSNSGSGSAARGRPPLAPKGGVKGSTGAAAIGVGATEQSVTDIAQQVRGAKQAGGYDRALHNLPAQLRAVNEVYVDYDADSDDERFVTALQAKLRKLPVTTQQATQKGTPSKSQPNSSPANASNTGTTVVPELKVRCVELMMARLEREFELARLFCSKSTVGTHGGGGSKPSKDKDSKFEVAMPYEPSKYAGSAPVGASSLQTRAQLRTALDGAISSYKLAKRFLAQCVEPATIGISPPPAPTTTPPATTLAQGRKGSGPSPAQTTPTTPGARFTRNGNVSNPQNAVYQAHPKSSAGALSAAHNSAKNGDLQVPTDFRALEKLQVLQQSRTAALFGNLAPSASSANLPELLRSSSSGSATNSQNRQRNTSKQSGPAAAGTRTAAVVDVKHSKEAKYGGNTDPRGEGSDEEDGDCYREYYSTEQITEMLPESNTVQLLGNVLRAYYHSGATLSSEKAVSEQPVVPAKNKVGRPPKIRTLSNLSVDSACSADLTQLVSAFGIDNEALIAHEVYVHWRHKRSLCSTSLVRAYHRYIMDLWSRADSVVVPMPSDYLHHSLAEARARLLLVRRALDRARLITDRVRRRERLKRDLVRSASEQFEVLQEELLWSIAAKRPDQPPEAVKKELTPSKKKPPSPPPKTTEPTAMGGGALHYVNQDRDRAGKFMSSRQLSRASKAAKATPASSKGKGKTKGGAASAAAAVSATSGAMMGPNRTGKSVKHQPITFRVQPASDDESAVDSAEEDEMDRLSSCSSSSSDEEEQEEEEQSEDSAGESDLGGAAVPGKRAGRSPTPTTGRDTSPAPSSATRSGRAANSGSATKQAGKRQDASPVSSLRDASPQSVRSGSSGTSASTSPPPPRRPTPRPSSASSAPAPVTGGSHSHSHSQGSGTAARTDLRRPPAKPSRPVSALSSAVKRGTDWLDDEGSPLAATASSRRGLFSIGRAGSTPGPSHMPPPATDRRVSSHSHNQSGSATSRSSSRASAVVPDCSLQKLPFTAAKNRNGAVPMSAAHTTASGGEASALKKRRL